MINGRRKTAAALAGAVVLGSAGYALGSGSGDGAASAAAGSASGTAPAGYGPGAGPRERGPRGARLADLASRLGVSEAKLRSALEAVRDDVAPQGERRDDHVKALADALGKTTAEVQAAFEKLHQARQDEFAATLAKELGIPASKVSAALDKLRAADKDGRERGGRREGLAGLAKELGVSSAKLRSALQAARPDRGPRDRDDHEAELAQALGVTAAQLEAAEKKAREADDAEHAARRKAFAAALAKELGISAAKVEDELGDGPFFGRHGGPGGPGGPGGRHHGPR